MSPSFKVVTHARATHIAMGLLSGVLVFEGSLKADLWT
jgi:hypothetical protein